MSKVAVGIRIDEDLVKRLQNAIWYLGRGLSITYVITEVLERELAKLEAENGGKPFPRRGSELPRSPVKRKTKSG